MLPQFPLHPPIQEWMKSLSPPSFKVNPQYDIPVPMRDSIKLSTDIWFPKGDGPFPAILVRTPYSKNGPTGMHVEEGQYFASRGYIWAVQDVRGRFDSPGDWTPARCEALDGYDAVEWLAEHPLCNGKVGMYGGSYSGIVQLLTAPLQPPHLVCLLPRVAYADMYKEWVYTGGAFALGLTLPWMGVKMSTHTEQPEFYDLHTGFPTTPTGVLEQHYWELPIWDAVERMGRHHPSWREWLSHPTNDDWWKPMTLEDKYDRINVPTYMIGGYYDLYVAGMLKNFVGISQKGATESARKGTRLVMGPWEHSLGFQGMVTRVAEVDFGPNVIYPMRESELRWFDYWLKGIANNLEREAPIKIFVMGENIWRDEYEYPLARTRFVKYLLHSKGQANSVFGDGVLNTLPPDDEPPDQFTYDPRYPVPTAGGHTCCPRVTNILTGPRNNINVETRPDVLVYTSPMLTEDIEVTGPIVARLFASSSARDTDFTAKLLDVSLAETGQPIALNVADGILRARYRNSFEKPELMTPGTIYEFEIDLLHTSNLFKRGHWIRLEISSSNFPQYDRNLNTGNALYIDAEMQSAHQTLYHDAAHPSHILLPIIPRT